MSALRPAVAIILLMANRLNCSTRSLVKTYAPGLLLALQSFQARAWSGSM